jgi:flagellar basal-body rod protein FlgB
MDISSISLFDLSSQKLEWLGHRQKVVSQNIANANTPGYKARDIASFENFIGGSRSTSLARTHDSHLQGQMRSTIPSYRDMESWDQSIDGNTVVLEQQTLKANKIYEEHQMVTQITKKAHGMLSMAITGR